MRFVLTPDAEKTLATAPPTLIATGIRDGKVAPLVLRGYPDTHSAVVLSRYRDQYLGSYVGTLRNHPYGPMTLQLCVQGETQSPWWLRWLPAQLQPTPRPFLLPIPGSQVTMTTLR